MKTYIRILAYVKPYWKHLLLSIICTVLFAFLNGISIYLTIPLLDTLFNESAKHEVVTQPSAVDKTMAILPRSQPEAAAPPEHEEEEDEPE